MATACSAEPEPDRPLAGSTSAAINKSVQSATPNSVVYLSTQKAGGPSNCTGVVITPGHVLTAAHCINGGKAVPLIGGTFQLPPGTPIRIQNTEIPDQQLLTPQPGEPLSYTPGPGQRPPTLDLTTPMNFAVPTVSERDLAIIPLDRRIDGTIASPAKLPFDAAGNPNPCSSSFSGTYYGYGGAEPWANPLAGRRQRGSTDVQRGFSIFGDVYFATFSATGQFFEAIPGLGEALSFLLGSGNYQLIGGGDSGGPLFEGGPSGKLCGINSMMWPFGISCDALLVCDIVMHNVHARVDNTISRTWILSHIVDGQGRFWGTCDQGPEALRDVDSDFDGIPDPCDPCRFIPDPNYWTTGEITTTPDADGDGVPDACDNCPDAKNPPNVTGADGILVQTDTDGDNVGDACDNCPRSDVRGVSDLVCCTTDADCGNEFGSQSHSRCFKVVKSPAIIVPCASAFGRCSRGFDDDLDNVIDSCDNCPGTWNIGQSDADGDGVGDACDNCPGLPCSNCGGLTLPNAKDRNDVSFMECTSDAQCATITGNANSVCVPGKLLDPPGVVLPAHCSQWPDADGDGVGTACDSCPGAFNPPSYVGGVNGQPNCNLDTEIIKGTPYPYVGDACDPNPCSRIDGAGNPEDVGGNLWVKLRYDPQLLPPTTPATLPGGQAPFDRSLSGAPSATVGGKFCDCQIPGVVVATARDCNDQGLCPIDAAHYDSSSQWFSSATVPLASVVDAPPSTPPASYSPELANLTLSVPLDVTNPAGSGLADYDAAHAYLAWNLTANGAHTVPNFGFNTGLLGVVWAAVRDVPQMQAASVTSFRAWSNRYLPGYFGKQLGNPEAGKVVSACKICDVDPCPHCLQLVDVKNLVIDPTQTIVSAQSSALLTDMTASFSVTAMQALTLPGVRWVQAAESGGWLRTEHTGLAALSSDGTTVRAALASRGGMMTSVLSRGPTDDLPAGAAADLPTMVSTLNANAADDVVPSPRTGHGVVLSAMENALFVIGGELPTGKFASDAWIFDLTRGRWQPLVVNGASPRNILAATYRVEDRSLYVLDVQQVGPLQQARLLRLNLNTLDAQVLGAWPRSGLNDRVDLTTAAFGALLLTGSSTKLNRIAGVVLNVGAHPVKASSTFTQPGTLALEPTLTDRGLTLPLAGGALGVHNVFVHADQLAPTGGGAGKGKSNGKGNTEAKAHAAIGDCL